MFNHLILKNSLATCANNSFCVNCFFSKNRVHPWVPKWNWSCSRDSVLFMQSSLLSIICCSCPPPGPLATFIYGYIDTCLAALQNTYNNCFDWQGTKKHNTTWVTEVMSTSINRQTDMQQFFFFSFLNICLCNA